MGRGRRVEAILSEFPEPTESQLIVRVTGTPGGNLLRVEDADANALVVRLPSKSRNTIWVRTGERTKPPATPSSQDSHASPARPGGFLIINASADAEEHGDVAHFLYRDQIRHLQNRSLWPSAFETGGREAGQGAAEELTRNPNHRGDSDSEESENEDDLMPNPNHARGRGGESESEDEDEDDEQEEGAAEGLAPGVGST